MLVAIILGILSGSILFLFYTHVFAEKPAIRPETVTLYDRDHILLYEGSLEANANNLYKRAPYAVNLSLRKIYQAYEYSKPSNTSPTVVTTIDLPLQNYLQAIILENQIAWQEKNIADVAVVVVDGPGWDVRAAVGSENYFEDPKGPIDTISFDQMNVFYQEACPVSQERQLLIWTTDSLKKPVENTEIKTFLNEKINEFEAQRGGESYGQNE